MANYETAAGLNWSSLKHIATSPRMYQWRLAHPEPRSFEFDLGSAAHCAILEPADFAARYAVYDGKRDARTKAYQEWQEANPNVYALKPRDLESITSIVTAVHSHRVASRLLDGAATEQEMEWRDPDTGILCKGRVDVLGSYGIADLKTCADPSPRMFRQAAARYLYHGQLAFYHFGAMESGLIPPDAERPYIIAAQSDEPFDVAVYQLSVSDLTAGRALCVELQNLLGACASADFWPGVAPDLMELNLPGWAAGMDSKVEVTV